MKLKENNRTYGIGTNSSGGASITILEISSKQKKEIEEIFDYDRYDSFLKFKLDENGRYTLSIKCRVTSHDGCVPGDGGINPVYTKVLKYYKSEYEKCKRS